MASHLFNVAKKHIADQLLDLTDDATHDFKAYVVMTNSTAGTTPEAANLAAITLGELDATGYTARNFSTATAITWSWTQDDVNDRVEAHLSADVDFGTAVANDGTRAIAGVLFTYVYSATEYCLAFDDDAGGSPGGGALTYTDNAEGVFYY